ncbi:MAG TPA: dihydroneopterin aldolase [Rickettsiales bacterium]|nr:dihydroneopterin aldolase [Rickettsiales bacterium]
MIIKIKNFRFQTILGIYDWEQKIDREITINAIIHTNFDKARFTHKIQDTIDYDDIINKIKDLLSNNKFKLIEELAQNILESIMKDKRIDKVELEIDKLRVVDNVESFSITLTQER